MKNICATLYLIIFIALNSQTLYSQFVTIPDTLFAGYIQYYYPGCIQGNQLDTTCPDIVSAKRIDFDPAASNFVKDLEGVQYFDSLVFLGCLGQDLTELKSLPPLLDTLYCGGNKNLKITAKFPSHLTTIEAMNCSLDTLPQIPKSLRYLNCMASKVTFIPNIPDSIILRANFNKLAQLPPLPNYVHTLFVQNNPDLHCLPWINTIGYLAFDTANIKCVPNYGLANGSTSTLQILPLCSSSNPYGCSSCYAYFSIYPDQANPGLYFAQNLSAGTGLSYLWDFGDGSTSTQQFPSHTYATPGNYNICLTVNDGTGCVHTYCNSSYLVFKNEGGLISQLTVLGPLQIDETAENLDFSVYPNPASTYIDITIHRATVKNLVRISDLTGKQIEVFELTAEANQLPLGNLSNGVYILTLTLPDGKTIKKRLIKQ